MTSRFNRGSSPGRARDASQLSGSFEAGHKKLGGRKKGTRNLISPERKMALLEAAHRLGSDGNGNAIATDIFAETVRGAGGASNYGPVVEIAFNVGGEFGSSAVAAVALMFESLHGDPIKITT